MPHKMNCIVLALELSFGIPQRLRIYLECVDLKRHMRGDVSICLMGSIASAGYRSARAHLSFYQGAGL